MEPVAYIESWRLPRSVLDVHITQADVDWLGELGYNFSAGVEVAGVMEVLADAAQKDVRDGQAGGLSSYEQYRRLAGEVEARNVEARQGMTDAQRLAIPPAATADVGDKVWFLDLTRLGRGYDACGGSLLMCDPSLLNLRIG